MKTTAASVERDLLSSLKGFKASASEAKEAHRAARKAILADDMISDKAKKERLEALDADTRSKLAEVRGRQDAYVANLKSKIERELRGPQPSDANSVLLRRDAADRARRIKDSAEAMEMLNDAINDGDDSLAHAIGNVARNRVWTGVADAYKAAHPDTADSAAALAWVESNTSGPEYNVANSITYSAPTD